MEFLKFIFTKSSKIPRWIIFLFDISLCIIGYILSLFTRFSFYPVADVSTQIVLALRVLPLYILIKGFTIGYFRLHTFIIRHTSVQDGLRIFYAMSTSSLLILLADFFLNIAFGSTITFFPKSIILIDFCLSIFFLSAFRVFIKLLYIRIIANNNSQTINYAIYGAGESGLTTKRKLEMESRGAGKVVLFFDDSSNKYRKMLDGVKIVDGNSQFEETIKKHNIENLIIAIPSITKSKKQELAEKCLALNINVKTIPPIEKWINGELSFNQIKAIKIEDLIEREIIELDITQINKQLNNKVVMVTGAAGSIGSELVVQILKFRPKKVICLDKSEVRLYDLEAQLKVQVKGEQSLSIEIVLADITNYARLKSLFEQYRPEIIYHAAAYKHVPLMEENPSEAVWVNVKGTKTLADTAVEFGVSKFVMVSTDKAVNPTNVMGASKRIAEIYVQSLFNEIKDKGKNTQFITTRFGNVLGSSGSVIPRFRKQIEEGGPITVTHPDITRYFMTIPEASQLVLEAGHMGQGGEIFIFDMGNSTKIIDLAKKMVKLSGLTLGKDIQIVYTGLRPGEKIYEELLNDGENTLPTHHHKIMIGKVRQYHFETVSEHVNELIALYENQNMMEIVSKMKTIVPEFKSKNSIYEQLDQ